MTTRSFLWGALLGAIAIAAFQLTIGIRAAFADDPEYILIIVDQRVQPGSNIGVVQVGMNRIQAQGAAFQLNEALKEHGLPVFIKIHTQSDIGNFKPKAKK
jgi:hypothetical protein